MKIDLLTPSNPT